eukprot:2186263-Rhodomonas_salina.1
MTRDSRGGGLDVRSDVCKCSSQLRGVISLYCKGLSLGFTRLYPTEMCRFVAEYCEVHQGILRVFL